MSELLKVKKDQTKAFSGNFLVYDSMIKEFYLWLRLETMLYKLTT